MNALLLTVGRLAGAAGVVMTLVAVVVRVTGHYWVAGYQTGTILLGGMAMMLIGCLSLLAVLVSGRSGGSL